MTGSPLFLLAPCRSLLEDQDSDGNNPFHLAAWCKQTEAMGNFLNLLAQQEASEFQEIINAQNFKKQTPLYLAVKHATLECTKMLLDSNANPILVDSEGNTLAHLLAGSIQECPELYRAVLATGQNLNLLNREGKKVLSKSCTIFQH